MRFREYPLLNTPSMIVIILRRGLDPPGTVTGCSEELQALLDRADEHPPFGPADMASRLDMLVHYLTEAKLVAPAEGGFATTPRGRAALEEHPQGFDTADLMVYPEFARYIRGVELRRMPLDPRATGYDQGFYAYWAGEMPADNPYAPDSADHLAWESGWSEALDEDFRWTGPRFAPGP